MQTVATLALLTLLSACGAYQLPGETVQVPEAFQECAQSVHVDMFGEPLPEGPYGSGTYQRFTEEQDLRDLWDRLEPTNLLRPEEVLGGLYSVRPTHDIVAIYQPEGLLDLEPGFPWLPAYSLAHEMLHQGGHSHKDSADAKMFDTYSSAVLFCYRVEVSK